MKPALLRAEPTERSRGRLQCVAAERAAEHPEAGLGTVARTVQGGPAGQGLWATRSLRPKEGWQADFPDPDFLVPSGACTLRWSPAPERGWPGLGIQVPSTSTVSGGTFRTHVHSVTAEVGKPKVLNPAGTPVQAA